LSASGLVLLTPELEPRIADLRARHDPAARQGMPAHVTVLYPFIDPARIGPDVRRRIGEVIGGFGGLELTFRRTGRFPDVLWVAPEPAAEIIALVRALAEAFPDYPPYGGEFESVVPHVTVAHGESHDLAALEPELRRRLETPVRQTVDAVALFTTVRRSWREIDRFPLA
jgi:2'-5' RNA ligase